MYGYLYLCPADAAIQGVTSSNQCGFKCNSTLFYWDASNTCICNLNCAGGVTTTLRYGYLLGVAGVSVELCGVGCTMMLLRLLL